MTVKLIVDNAKPPRCAYCGMTEKGHDEIGCQCGGFGGFRPATRAPSVTTLYGAQDLCEGFEVEATTRGVQLVIPGAERRMVCKTGRRAKPQASVDELPLFSHPEEEA